MPVPRSPCKRIGRPSMAAWSIFWRRSSKGGPFSSSSGTLGSSGPRAGCGASPRCGRPLSQHVDRHDAQRVGRRSLDGSARPVRRRPGRIRRYSPPAQRSIPAQHQPGGVHGRRARTQVDDDARRVFRRAAAAEIERVVPPQPLFDRSNDGGVVGWVGDALDVHELDSLVRVLDVAGLAESGEDVAQQLVRSVRAFGLIQEVDDIESFEIAESTARMEQGAERRAGVEAAWSAVEHKRDARPDVAAEARVGHHRRPRLLQQRDGRPVGMVDRQAADALPFQHHLPGAGSDLLPLRPRIGAKVHPRDVKASASHAIVAPSQVGAFWTGAAAGARVYVPSLTLRAPRSFVYELFCPFGIGAPVRKTSISMSLAFSGSELPWMAATVSSIG